MIATLQLLKDILTRTSFMVTECAIRTLTQLSPLWSETLQGFFPNYQLKVSSNSIISQQNHSKQKPLNVITVNQMSIKVVYFFKLSSLFCFSCSVEASCLADKLGKLDLVLDHLFHNDCKEKVYQHPNGYVLSLFLHHHQCNYDEDDVNLFLSTA